MRKFQQLFTVAMAAEWRAFRQKTPSRYHEKQIRNRVVSCHRDVDVALHDAGVATAVSAQQSRDVISRNSGISRRALGPVVAVVRDAAMMLTYAYGSKSHLNTWIDRDGDSHVLTGNLASLPG